MLWSQIDHSSESQLEDKLQIYRENFERAYLESTETFYKVMCAQYLAATECKTICGCRAEAEGGGILGQKVPRIRRICPILVNTCVDTIVTNYRVTILAECPKMLIKANETDKVSVSVMSAINELKLMFKLMDRESEGVTPMLSTPE